MRLLLACLLLFATPAMARGEPRLPPGAICLPAAPQAAAEQRRARHATRSTPLRRALLTCLAAAEGARKRPIRLT
jgi:hypothetical protein